jgi:hypothetical protein
MPEKSSNKTPEIFGIEKEPARSGQASYPIRISTVKADCHKMAAA